MKDKDYFKSPMANLANQELSWLPMDTENLYKKNLKTKRKLLKKYNWIDQKFTYKINSDGFRCERLKENQDCIIFFGCSFTIGIGLPIETVWPTIVAEKLGLKCYNLGIGGGSNDTAFRLGYYYIPKLKPKLVILLDTFSDRFELFDQDRNFVQYGHWSADSYYKKWSFMDINGQINQTKNALALSSICGSNDARFLKFSVNDMEPFDLARDLCHNGVKSNKVFAEKVLKSLD